MYVKRRARKYVKRVHPVPLSRLGSDEEDDVIRHHHLVVVLHLSQSISDFCLAEVLLAALVDVIHQRLHLHRLSMSRLEDCKQ